VSAFAAARTGCGIRLYSRVSIEGDDRLQQAGSGARSRRLRLSPSPPTPASPVGPCGTSTRRDRLKSRLFGLCRCPSQVPSGDPEHLPTDLQPGGSSLFRLIDQYPPVLRRRLFRRYHLCLQPWLAATIGCLSWDFQRSPLRRSLPKSPLLLRLPAPEGLPPPLRDGQNHCLSSFRLHGFPPP